MIVKMKFISITGPKNDIDRVTDQYLSKYEIQLENALSELKTTENLQPFVEINPYREALEKAKQLALYVKDQKPEDTPELSIERYSTQCAMRIMITWNCVQRKMTGR